jgi:hypothetical protein
MWFIRPSYRLECNDKRGVKETGLGNVEWINLARDGDKCRTVFSTVINLLLSQNVGHFLTGWRIVSLSGRTVPTNVASWFVGWLVGWLVFWLVGWLFGRLVGCVAG